MAAANSTSRGQNNTAFSVNPDKLAQLVGSGGPPPGPISPTFAAAVVLDSIINYANVIRILGVNSVSSACAVTTANVALAGAILVVICEAVGGTVTYTFGSGFKTSATAAATTGTSMTVTFHSNGTNWVEASRSLAIAT